MAGDTRLSAECQRLLELIRKQCPDLLPASPVPTGTVTSPIRLPSDQATALFAPAAAVAAGLDPLATASAPSTVKWQEGDRELLVFPARVTARFGSGVIAVAIPVSCDQTGDSVVYVSFVVGSPNQPAVLIAATDARPQGPGAIVDAWGDALIAFAWHVVLEVVRNVAGAAGRDVDGSRLVPIGLAASADSILIVPMARHPFDRKRG
jgi:hypothetical protein